MSFQGPLSRKGRCDHVALGIRPVLIPGARNRAWAVAMQQGADAAPALAAVSTMVGVATPTPNTTAATAACITATGCTPSAAMTEHVVRPQTAGPVDIAVHLPIQVEDGGRRPALAEREQRRGDQAGQHKLVHDRFPLLFRER